MFLHIIRHVFCHPCSQNPVHYDLRHLQALSMHYFYLYTPSFSLVKCYFGYLLFCLPNLFGTNFLFVLFLDNVFEQILNSSSPGLAEARKILRNIICRRLYKCLGQTQADKTIIVTQVCIRIFVWIYCYRHLLATSSILYY